MRAKNLLAKDPNGELLGEPGLGSAGAQVCCGLSVRCTAGFSDPYCMLGILPASGTPRQPSGHKEQRFSFRKSSRRGVPLPAKCIQVTEVKSSTLNPEWKEHFLL